MASQQITSTDIAQRPDVYIEPGTGPAMVPYSPAADDDAYADLSIEVVGDDFGTFESESGEFPQTGSALDAPDVLTVISQTPRINPDGMTVMDLVLEIGDVLGATGYEMRFVT